MVARTLAKAGCRDFFVATLGEAVELRPALPENARLYCFDGYHVSADALYRKHAITPVINTPQQVAAWTAKRRRWRPALHVDTGMTRLGLSREEFASLKDGGLLAQLDPELVISHFACADDPADGMNARQIAAFGEAAAHFPLARKSLANSAGVFLGAGAHFDLLRPGIALYGGEAVNDVANPMKPVVRLEGRILQIRRAKKGETVGYGATHVLAGDSITATIGVGYADGYHRAASGSGTALRKAGIGQGARVMIGRHCLPLVGRVSMDAITADLTGLPKAALGKLERQLASGDAWADLINREIRVDDMARSAGTIGYEILTSLGRRHERIYVNG